MSRASFVQTRQKAGSVSDAPSGILQRKCACGKHTGAGGKCDACQREEDRISLRNGHPSNVGQQRLDNLSAQSMGVISRVPSGVIGGVNGVHVHTDRAAVQLTGKLHAHALTVGNDIYLGQEASRRGTRYRDEVLAHELVHVVQQRRGNVRPTVQFGGLMINDEPRLERQAEEPNARRSSLAELCARRLPSVSGGLSRGIIQMKWPQVRFRGEIAPNKKGPVPFFQSGKKGEPPKGYLIPNQSFDVYEVESQYYFFIEARYKGVKGGVGFELGYVSKGFVVAARTTSPKKRQLQGEERPPVRGDVPEKNAEPKARSLPSSLAQSGLIDADLAFLVSFLESVQANMDPATFAELEKKIVNSPLAFYSGYQIGFTKGSADQIWQAIKALVAMAVSLAPAGLAIDIWKRHTASPAELAKMEEEREQILAAARVLRAVLEEHLKDPAFLTGLAAELGPEVGQVFVEKVADFVDAPVRKQGEMVGDVVGRLFVEILMFFVAPESLALRGAAKVSQGARTSGRLRKVLLSASERVPALKRILETKGIVGTGAKAKIAAHAGKEVADALRKMNVPKNGKPTSWTKKSRPGEKVERELLEKAFEHRKKLVKEQGLKTFETKNVCSAKVDLGGGRFDYIVMDNDIGKLHSEQIILKEAQEQGFKVVQIFTERIPCVGRKVGNCRPLLENNRIPSFFGAEKADAIYFGSWENAVKWIYGLYH